MKSMILYPAIPPAPAAPSLTQAVNGALGSRTEYYLLTYVTPFGEASAGAEASISVAAGSVAIVAPPDYPYPFAIYGYNVYAAGTSGAEVLQNGSMPVLPGLTWNEPSTGLVTGTAPPPTSWTASTLTFGIYTYPTKVPAYVREMSRHKNISSAGVLETIYEHTENFIDLDLDFVSIGADVANWDTFVQFAERGGIFSFYPDSTVGGGGAGFTNYTLWDDNWTAAYKAPQLYSFKMKWREAGGGTGSGPINGGGGGSSMFGDNITPVDGGDHQHFTLPQAPNPTASLELFLNGVIATDYTLAGTAITFGSAISGTFTLQAWYRF